MKRSPSRPSTVCNLLLGFVSTIHTATGVLVIAFQVKNIEEIPCLLIPLNFL